MPTLRSPRASSAATLLSILLLASACGGDSTGPDLTPASISPATSATVNATVGTAVTPAPAVIVKNRGGTPIPNVSITFAVAQGGGSVQGATVITNAAGVATVGGWTLGTASGANRITATAGDPATSTLSTSITATAVADAPHTMLLTAGYDQIAEVGTAVSVAPAVTIRDQYGNATEGRSVTFAVTGGGGTVSGGSASVNAQGVAKPGSWTLGAGEGINTITAAVAGLPLLEIIAKGVPHSDYSVTLRYLTTTTSAQRAAFANAAARWSKVITGDLAGGGITLDANTCQANEPALDETIDDVLIYVSLVHIDGRNGVLGSAYPCIVRSDGGLTAVGVMRFDTADVAALAERGQLEAVILHEMGHVLGVGTFWGDLGFVTGAGTADPYYTGASARAGFQLVGGAAYGGTPVPVENVGGAGTADAHWRNSVLRTELMTGFAEGSAARLPLSMVTVGALEDLGYTITPYGYDQFTFGTDLVAAPSIGASGTMTVAAPPFHLLEERPPMAPLGLDATGRLTALRANPVRTSAGRVQALARKIRALPAPAREVRATERPR